MGTIVEVEIVVVVLTRKQIVDDVEKEKDELNLINIENEVKKDLASLVLITEKHVDKLGHIYLDGMAKPIINV